MLFPATGRAAIRSAHEDADDAEAGLSDGSLTTAARRALEASGCPCLAQVDVSVEHGTLVLAGRVPSWILKQVAQTAARRLDAVDGIVNRIEVASAASHGSQSDARKLQ